MGPSSPPAAPPATAAAPPDPADDAAAAAADTTNAADAADAATADDPTVAPTPARPDSPAPQVGGGDGGGGDAGRAPEQHAGGGADDAPAQSTDDAGEQAPVQPSGGADATDTAPVQTSGGNGDGVDTAPARSDAADDVVARSVPEQPEPAAAEKEAADTAADGDGGGGAPKAAATARSRSASPAAPAAKRLKADPDVLLPPVPSTGDDAADAPASAKTERYPVLINEPEGTDAASSAAAGAEVAAPASSSVAAAGSSSAAAGGADDAMPLPRLSADAEAGLSEIFETGACSASDVNGRVREYLASLPDATARAAIADLATRDFSSVRNRPAFVMSCVKKAAAVANTAAASGGPGGGASGTPASVPPSALAHLPIPVGDGLQRVFATGVCHPSQFDDRAMDILVELPTHAAVRALSEFAAVPPSRVRNPSAFWMGLARKHKSAVAAAALSGQGPPQGGMPNMGYGPPPMAQPYGAPQGYGQPMHHQPPPSSYDYHQVHQPPAYGGYEYGGQYGQGGYGPPPMASGGGGYYDSRPPPVAAGMVGVAPAYGAQGGGSRVAARVDALVAARVVRPGDVDARAIEALGRLREPDALAALDELAAAEPSRVRNPSAYVMGLARKYAAASAAAYPGADGGGDGGGPAGGGMGSVASGGLVPGPVAGGGGPVAAGGGLWNTMDGRVREKYESLVASGVLPSIAFDSRAVAALAALSPADGIASLDELAASDPTRVRNLSAYYMGVARKFARMPEGR